jgi:hypothetical protein
VTRAGAFGIAAALLGAFPASAQSTPESWEVTLAPYVFGASLDGETTVRGLTADVDASAGDVFDNMDYGFTSIVAARKGSWGILGEVLWVDLGIESDLPPADLDTRLGILTVEGVRRLAPFADLTFGARWQHLHGGIRLHAPPFLDVEGSRDFVDPVVGVVLRTPWESRWHGTLIADIGGFGVGSDLSWQAFPSVGFDVTKRASLELGWRVLDTDYEDGSGTHRFVYDMRLSGPAVGFTYRFGG